MGDIDRLGCASLMESIHKLYATNEWVWEQPANFPEHFYIAALFGQPSVNFSINYNIVDEICDKLTYWQTEKSSHLSDSTIKSFELALIVTMPSYSLFITEEYKWQC